jgi:DNA-binding HxlR family transcriptional regulator
MVSNKKYKKALEDCDRYRRMLDAKQGKDWFVLHDLMRYKDENEKLSEQVVEYKQKYLDEQQKRLELAELVNRMECESQCQVDITI